MSQQVVEALAQQRNLFLPRPRAVRPAPAPCAARARAAPREERSGCASGRRAARPARKSIRWRCCSPKSRSNGAAGRSTSSAPTFRPRASIARAPATYSQFEVQRGLGINQMIKWFEECADGWRAVEALRKPVRFQVHNLLEPPPHPGGFDIVLCRNVLLYLSPEKKALAFERIAGAMAEDGWLMLGAGETVIGQTKQARRRHQCARPLPPASATAAASRSAAARPQEPQPGLDRDGRSSCAIAARGLRLHRSAFAQFRRAAAAGLDDRAPLYRNARRAGRARPADLARGQGLVPLSASTRTAPIYRLVDEAQARLARRQVALARRRPTSIRPASASRSSIPATSSAIAPFPDEQMASRDPAGRRHQGAARDRPRQCRRPFRRRPGAQGGSGRAVPLGCARQAPAGACRARRATSSTPTGPTPASCSRSSGSATTSPTPQKAVIAFQRRFRPDLIDGIIDGECRAKLLALLLPRPQ